jgi:hypothetical protein
VLRPPRRSYLVESCSVLRRTVWPFGFLGASGIIAGPASGRPQCGCAGSVFEEQHLIMTETVPARPFDDMEALAWLRSQPDGRVTASAAELGRRWAGTGCGPVAD